MSSVTATGVYYGYAQVIAPEAALGIDHLNVFPMVMSLGWNPFYKNERLTAVRRDALLRAIIHTYLSTGSPYHARF